KKLECHSFSEDVTPLGFKCLWMIFDSINIPPLKGLAGMLFITPGFLFHRRYLHRFFFVFILKC
ncbi:MAG: hypothetical protein WCO98_12050, partial [bacterium]